jgi:predicted dehydrogenase
VGTGVGIGIVGTGFLATTRARCWSRVAGASVVAVAGRRPDAAREFIEQAREHLNDAGSPPTSAERSTRVHAHESVDRLLSDDSVFVVDVCVPNVAHPEIVRAAAAAGKHVICTKPLAAYVGQDLDPKRAADEASQTEARKMQEIVEADGLSMVQAAREAGVSLCYGENWIYAPSIVRAASLLDESEAVVLEMRGGEGHSGSHSEYAKRWSNTGGGALLRLGAHPIGVMLYLKRREGKRRRGRAIEPVSVLADVADLTQVEGIDPAATALATGWRDVENWGQVSIEFDDGSRGVAWGSDNRLGGMRSELEIFSANSTIQCNLSPADQVRAYTPNDQVYPDAYLIEKQSTTAGWSTPMTDEDWSSGQLGMCQSFADAIRRGESPESDGQLGVDVGRVIYAAYASAREGRRVAIDPLA